MKYCPHCHVKVANEKNICPLCFSVLKDTDDPTIIQPYPHKKEKHILDMTHKILVCISIIAVIASIIVNYLTFDSSSPMYWSVLVVFGIPYIWLIVRYVILTRGFWGKKIFSLTFTTIIFIILFDLFFRLIAKDFSFMWSITYVVPGFLALATVVTYVLSSVFKHWYTDNIANLWVFNFLLMVYFVLGFFFKTYINEYISYSCLFVSLTTQILMIIFHRKDTLEELHKRFHIF